MLFVFILNEILPTVNLIFVHGVEKGWENIQIFYAAVLLGRYIFNDPVALGTADINKNGPGQPVRFAFTEIQRVYSAGVFRLFNLPAFTSSNSCSISLEGGAVIRETTTMHRLENRKAGSNS